MIRNENHGVTTMHKSQLAGFIIDCQTEDLDRAANVWDEE